MTLDQLNALPEHDAEGELLKCCGSRRWAELMAAARPFQNTNIMFDRAERIWWNLDSADWLEAFGAHPRIGETKPDSAWSAQEQAGMDSAAASMVAKLARDNENYVSKFGYIFIVCATGKSAEEMLSMLSLRLLNDAETELRIAAGEQSKITRLRLEKLIAA